MNRTNKKEIRKELRNHGTPAEATLWRLLKGKQIANLKFRRQHSVGPYILDFFCPELMLAVELDGEFHTTTDAQIHDEEREDYLFKKHHIHILRFENRVVFENAEIILQLIEEFKDRQGNSPTTPP